jgi:3-methyl-2-oxobutanoate hydroxymethyltransferase
MTSPSNELITIHTLHQRKAEGRRISMITAYDATFARLFDQARGARRAHIVGDMPFMSYQASPEQALASAGRLVKEGFAHAVKLEGGAEVCGAVKAIWGAGIPVMGHLGLTPQSVHRMGGFKVQGRQEEQARRILDDALALEAAGCYAIVIEGVPVDLGQAITEALHIPTIGIGAGVHCDGQVLVSYDLLGLVQGFQPKFVKRYANLADEVTGAVQRYVAEVQSGAFPAAEHSYASPAARDLNKTEDQPIPIKRARRQ